MEVDLLLKTRCIVPVDTESLVLEAHALAVGNGAILDVFSNAAAEPAVGPKGGRQVRPKTS